MASLSPAAENWMGRIEDAMAEGDLDALRAMRSPLADDAAVSEEERPYVAGFLTTALGDLSASQGVMTGQEWSDQVSFGTPTGVQEEEGLFDAEG